MMETIERFSSRTRRGEILIKRCRDCSEVFDLSEGELRFFAMRALQVPTRCRTCRARRRQETAQETIE